MAVKILTSDDGQVMYCSVTMWAFGPVHENKDFDLEDFLEWLPQDARRYTDKELEAQYYRWLTDCKARQSRQDEGSSIFDLFPKSIKPYQP